MTTYSEPELSFPSAPIDGDTRAVVEAVANDWNAWDDWRRFERACRGVALHNNGLVVTSWVRDFLEGDDHVRPIPSRRLSAFYNRATGKNGFLDFSHWGINTDVKGRNAGRPARIYKLRVTA